MIMGLCLLVYSLGQRALRQSLKRGSQTIQNQLGKPTGTPTLPWVFQCFPVIRMLATAMNGFYFVNKVTTHATLSVNQAIKFYFYSMIALIPLTTWFPCMVHPSRNLLQRR